MIYNFDTDDKNRAIASLCVYAVYRSRNIDRFKVSTKMWDQIAGFVKLSSKKSKTIPEFIEKFRKPMKCESLIPKYCKTDESLAGAKMLEDGQIFVSGEKGRSFLTSMLENCEQKEVLSRLYKETSFIIMLVRERLEIEKQTEKIGEE